jgi:hypothetical protein
VIPGVLGADYGPDLSNSWNYAFAILHSRFQALCCCDFWASAGPTRQSVRKDHLNQLLCTPLTQLTEAKRKTRAILWRKTILFQFLLIGFQL